jgi:hypothetical protein
MRKSFLFISLIIFLFFSLSFKLINKDTGKQVKSSKYIIEHLDWQPLDAQ